MNLRNRVSAIHDVPPPKSFTFLSDACRGLEQARKVAAGGRGEERDVLRGSGPGWGNEEEAGGGQVPGLSGEKPDLAPTQVLAYACVYSFYNQDTEHMDVVEQQTENLELHTNALQILLGETQPHLFSPLLPLSPLGIPPQQTRKWAKQCPPSSSQPSPVPRSPVAIGPLKFHRKVHINVL